MFLRIFKVAFLLFLTPTGSPNPAGQSPIIKSYSIYTTKRPLIGAGTISTSFVIFVEPEARANKIGINFVVQKKIFVENCLIKCNDDFSV